MKSRYRFALVLLSALLLPSCAQYENKRGVLDHWQDSNTGQFTSGQTSRQQVMAALGPPSQVIALGEETVLYYLYEHSEGEGLILLVYNRFKVNTQYDRAIFFFDNDDFLTDYATHFAIGAEVK